uniref:NADH dehydrogenase subunit 4L n=1 Tax=Plectus acuminatus TaxID=70689 RepID=A0A1U7AFS0_PLEAC|nr:NADH dehydrogenase subunit 4L [Plectus acuminatus]
MIYFFNSLAAVTVKSSRLVFLLVMLEFFVLSLIMLGVMNLDFVMYFFTLTMSVISSVTGLLVLLVILKSYGEDLLIL